MPQGMKRSFSKAESLQGTLVLGRRHVRVAGRAIEFGKDKRLWLRFSEAKRDTLFQLFAPVVPHDANSAVRQADIAPAMLGFWSLNPDTLFCLFESLLNPHAARLKIDILPAKRENFAAPHSSGKRERDNRIECPSIEGVKDLGYLLRAENLYLMLLHLGGIDRTDRVPCDDIPLDRVTQRAMEDAVDMPHGTGRQSGVLSLSFTEELGIQAREYHRPELLDADASDVRPHMKAQQITIPFVRLGGNVDR